MKIFKKIGKAIGKAFGFAAKHVDLKIVELPIDKHGKFDLSQIGFDLKVRIKVGKLADEFDFLNDIISIRCKELGAIVKWSDAEPDGTVTFWFERRPTSDKV